MWEVNSVCLPPWWRHQMETFSALLAICAANSPVPGEFPAQRPVTRIFGVFFDLRLNKRLRKQSWGCWFETLSRPLWRQRNVGALFDIAKTKAVMAVFLAHWPNCNHECLNETGVWMSFLGKRWRFIQYVYVLPCLYYTVNFLHNPHNKHAVVRPSRLLQCGMQHVVFDCVITASGCTYDICLRQYQTHDVIFINFFLEWGLLS